MTQLRDLLFGYAEGETLEPQEFVVYSTSIQQQGDGGRCCLWTVPAGKSYAVFEMWSGGGSGAGARCCRHGGGSGAGGYAVKGCTVSPGQQIQICAAGSGCCTDSTQNGGICGCCTWVCSLGGGGQGTWSTILPGGHCVHVPTECFYFANCYDCCSSCYCCGGIASNADINFPGVNGGAHPTQHCYNDGYQTSANAPFTAGGMRMGYGGCCAIGGGNGWGMFPGGGGLSAQTYGGGWCCGSPGAGGMVYVVYY
mgnify:CR=1 FL=1